MPSRYQELARVASQQRDRLLYALSNLSAANFFKTLTGGGEAGVATGFGVCVEFIPQAAAFAQTQMLYANAVTGSPASGVQFYISTTGLITPAISNGVGYPTPPQYQLVASDVGRVMTALLYYDSAKINLFIGRDARGVPVTQAFAPSSGRVSTLGNFESGSAPTDKCQILALATFRGQPNTTQVQDYLDRAHLLGDLPDTMQGATITHRESVRDQLRKLGAAVTSGQTAPATLDDTITGAAVDAMARQGAPTVVTIDPARDGRRMLGALGFDGSNGFASAAGAGIGGANGGWWLADVETIYPGTTANRYLVSRAAGPTGYTLDVNAAGTALRVIAYDGSGAPLTLTASLTTADHGRPMPIVLRHDGSTLKLYLRRAEAASGALAGFSPSAASMRIGLLSGCEGRSWHALMGGNGVISGAQALSIFDDFESTGTLQRIANFTDHYYDPTTDMLAAGETMPAQVLDRIGTDHLTTKGGLTVASGNGVSGLNNTSYYSTPSGTGPAAGSLAAGIAVAWWGRIDSQAVSGGNRFPFGQGNVVNTGCVFQTTGTNSSMYFRLGTGSALVDRSVAIAASDVGTPQLFVGWLDPGTGTSRLFYKGAEVGSGAAVSAYSPGAVPLKLGNAGNGTDATDGGYTTFGGGVYQGVTLAEVLGLYTTLASIGRMPTVPGKTLWHVDLTQDIPAAGGKVPAIATDRTGTVNAALVGSGLQVAQRTERLWNYETSPIMASTSCPTTSDYWQTAAPVLIGGQASWWRAVPIIVTSQSVPSSAGRHIVSSCLGSPNRGWALYFSGTNSALLGTAANSSNAFTTLSFGAISSTDIGKVLFAFVVYDAPLGKLRAFVRRAEVGTGITQAGYTPADGIVRVTNGILSANPGEGFQVLGFMGGEGLPTLAEIQASHDAFLASDGDLARAAIAGKTDYAQTFKGLANAPASVAPLIGSAALTKNGSPTIVPQYARAAGW